MPIQPIDPKTAQQWIEQEEAVVIDVREPAEHGSVKIEGAYLLPLDRVCKNTLPEWKGKKILLHCHSGKRSAMACAKLLAEDATLVLYNIEGGITAWEDAGLPVVCSGKRLLPLPQQVQLSVGLCMLLGCYLAYFVDIYYLLIPTFFGAGLTFAGLTGICGLAKILAKMPWNQRFSNNPAVKTSSVQDR